MKKYEEIIHLLGDKATFYLDHVCGKINKNQLQIPQVNIVDKVFIRSDRNTCVLGSLSQLYNHGNLSESGYLIFLPVNQGAEGGASVSFYKSPEYFNPENIINLAIETGCNGVVCTFGVMGLNARKYAHKIPFIVKINHNELLTYPNKYDQTLFARLKSAWNLGAVVAATIYFGSKESNKQLEEIAEAFKEALSLGMVTVLLCYVRSEAFITDKEDCHASTDLTSQANHLGVSIQADIIKQKISKKNYGFKNINIGKFNDAMYKKLTSEHPVDLCRMLVTNCYMGNIGLINSVGSLKGASDLTEAVITANINKRVRGSGLILGRKAFQRPFNEGVELLNTVKRIYLEDKITIA